MAHQIESNKTSGKQYKYTYSSRYLTEDQRDFYEKNGYVVFRNLVDHKILDEAQQRFIDICNKKVVPGMMIVMKDQSLKYNKNITGEYLINKIQDVAYDDVLFNYIKYQPMVDIVESIIGPNISTCHSMLINKPPDSTEDTSRHPLHQDLHYFPFRPAHLIVATWTAMEKIDEKNGCLFVVPASHTRCLYKHDYPPNINNRGYHGVIGFDYLPTVNLVMEKGDTVFFHPLLLHGSGPNLTKGFRKAISSHYANSNCAFVDVRGTSQENIQMEVEQMFRAVGFPQANLENVWKLKCRLVRGTNVLFPKLHSVL